MRSTPVANQQRVALRIVAGIIRLRHNLNQASIGILRLPCRDTLRHNTAASVATNVYHLRTRICLLEVVGHCHRVELAYRVVTHKHTARIFPSYCRACFYLCPEEVSILLAKTSLGYKVVDSALTLFVARVPILHCRVLHLGISLHNYLDHCGVQLIFIALRSSTALQITYIRPLVSYNQRTLELTCTLRIDTEVGRKFHRTTHPLRDIAERAVRKDRCIECCVKIIGIRHYRAKILAHQLGIFAYSLRDWTEDNTLLRQLLLEGGLYRHRIEYRIDCYTCQDLLLLQRNTEFVECRFEFRVHLVHRSELLLLFRCCEVDNIVEINLRNIEMSPCRVLHRKPMAIRLQAEFEHPFRLLFLLRNKAYNLLVQTFRDKLGLDIGGKAVLVVRLLYRGFNIYFFLFHSLFKVVS